MSGIKMSIDGIPKLERELQRLNSVRFDAVGKKQLAQMLNRARQPGGTPVSTEKTRPGGPHGELRSSSSVNEDEMGYMAEYGPHVEYGHRTIDGGFVQGQHFLRDNVETQRPIYKQDLQNAIKKG